MSIEIKVLKSILNHGPTTNSLILKVYQRLKKSPKFELLSAFSLKSLNEFQKFGNKWIELEERRTVFFYRWKCKKNVSRFHKKFWTNFQIQKLLLRYRSKIDLIRFGTDLSNRFSKIKYILCILFFNKNGNYYYSISYCTQHVTWNRNLVHQKMKF